MGTNKRPTPSGFMMNGPMWSLGWESALKSGTSLPAHFAVASFHQTCLREGSQGFPSISHEARLYITRRLAGQENAQFGKIPKPEGSSVPRRAIRFPASVNDPQYSQFPDEVVPSSLSHEYPGNCCPAF